MLDHDRYGSISGFFAALLERFYSIEPLGKSKNGRSRGICREWGGISMLEHIDEQPEMWRAIAHHPLNSLFSSQCWTEAVARTYGFKVSVSMKGIENDGKADGAILYCQLSDLKGERIVCGPFSDYCDPLISDVDTWRELVAPLISLGFPITLRCLSNQLPAKDERFVKVSEAAWHGVDRAGPGCLNRVSASIGGASAGVRLPCGVAAG
jgi:hypothetical protein